MTEAWQIPMTGPLADQVDRVHAALPVIETERLRLRPARIEDQAVYAEIYGSPRWPHDAAPTDEDIWLDFCQLVAGWLLRGTGLLAITPRGTDEVLGFVMVNHEHGDPELELGWMLTEAAEGRGIAAEAATALRDHMAGLGLSTLVSYIAPVNSRSAALARRLGARRDAAAEAALPDETQVWRHRLTEIPITVQQYRRDTDAIPHAIPTSKTPSGRTP